MQTIIPVHQARKQLGELINQAFYQGKPFVLTRGKKPMAALIGTQEFKEIIKLLEKHNPALADTLAIMTNPEVQAIFAEDEKHLKVGKTIPLDEA